MDWLGYDPAAVVIRAGQDSALLDQLGEVGRTLEAIVKASGKNQEEQGGQNQGAVSDHTNTKEDNPRQLLEEFDLATVLAIVWGGKGNPEIINQLRGFASNLSRYVKLAKGTLRGEDYSSRPGQKHPLTVEGPSPGKGLAEVKHSDVVVEIVPPPKKHKGPPSRVESAGTAHKSHEVQQSPQGDYGQTEILDPLVQPTTKQLLKEDVELQDSKTKLQQGGDSSNDGGGRSVVDRNRTVVQSRPGVEPTRPVFTDQNSVGIGTGIVNPSHGGSGASRHEFTSNRGRAAQDSTIVSPHSREQEINRHIDARDSGNEGSKHNSISSPDHSPMRRDASVVALPSEQGKKNRWSTIISTTPGSESLRGKEETTSSGVDADLELGGRGSFGSDDAAEPGLRRGDLPTLTRSSSPGDVHKETGSGQNHNDNRPSAVPSEQRGLHSMVAPASDTANSSEEGMKEIVPTNTPDADLSLRNSAAVLPKHDSKDRTNSPVVTKDESKQLVTGVKGPGQYQAVDSFQGKEEFEKLSFLKGDIITVDGSKPLSGNWVWGILSKSGKSGWCPQSYFVELPSPAAPPPVAIHQATVKVPTATNLSNWDDDPDTFLPPPDAEPSRRRLPPPAPDDEKDDKAPDELKPEAKTLMAKAHPTTVEPAIEPEQATAGSSKPSSATVAKPLKEDDRRSGLPQETIQQHLEMAVTAATATASVQGGFQSRRLERYEAIRSFSGDFKDCKLSFAAGDIITVESSLDSNGDWVWGNLVSSGRGGWCPTSRLKLIEAPKGTHHTTEEDASGRAKDSLETGTGETERGGQALATRVAIQKGSPNSFASFTWEHRSTTPIPPGVLELVIDAGPSETHGGQGKQGLELVSSAAGYRVYRTPTSSDPQLSLTPGQKAEGANLQYTVQIHPIEVGPTVCRRFLRIEETNIPRSPGLIYSEIARNCEEMGLGNFSNSRNQIVFSSHRGFTKILYLKLNGGFCELPNNHQQKLKIWVLKQSRFPEFPSGQFMNFGRSPDRPSVPVFWKQSPHPSDGKAPTLYYYVGHFRCVSVEAFEGPKEIRFKAKQCQACLHLEFDKMDEKILRTMTRARETSRREHRRKTRGSDP